MIIMIIIIIIISCHRHFFPVLLLNQRWSPPLTLQVSQCSTFRIMCYVPSIAVFCSESVECFPGTASKFFLKLLVTIPVAPVITGIIVHFRFHIRCICIHKLLYFNFFSAFFPTPFCVRVLPHLSVCMLHNTSGPEPSNSTLATRPYRASSHSIPPHTEITLRNKGFM